MYERQRVLYLQPTGPNPHNHRDNVSGPALRHESSNLLFQVALYIPFSGTGIFGVKQLCKATQVLTTVLYLPIATVLLDNVRPFNHVHDNLSPFNTSDMGPFNSSGDSGGPFNSSSGGPFDSWNGSNATVVEAKWGFPGEVRPRRASLNSGGLHCYLLATGPVLGCPGP